MCYECVVKPKGITLMSNVTNFPKILDIRFDKMQQN